MTLKKWLHPGGWQLRMRKILLICFLIIAFCSKESQAQNISLQYKDAKLKKVIADLEKQTGLHFISTREELDNAMPVSIVIKNRPIEEALAACFDGQQLSYSIDGKYVTIRKKKEELKQINDEMAKGKAMSENGEALEGITVSNKRTGKSVATDGGGAFALEARTGDTLLFSGVSIKAQSMVWDGRTNIHIKLAPKIAQLQNLTVEYSTGYQQLPKERATGSFDFISNEQLSRSTSTDILGRIDGIASAVLFTKNIVPSENQPYFSIRGRSTLFANPEPLIVVDNFPYEGDISNINPNDVESISILKDAAAASIWGARSGNGVLVITTKKGAYGKKPKLSFTNNTTIGQKPDLYYLPNISSADFVDLTQFLFDKGYYNNQLSNGYSALSPAVDILNRQKNGLLGQAEAAQLLNELKKNDIRKELDKYYYRQQVNQQYAASLSGGSADDQYFFSAGLDRNAPNLVRNSYQRITLNAKNTYALMKHRLELSSNIVFTNTEAQNNNSGNIGKNFPYTSLTDASGKPIPIQKDYRASYTDTAGKGKLLNWQYFPLDELGNADNRSNTIEYRIILGMKYKIMKGLHASIHYQYTNGRTETNNLQSQETYYTRDLINKFAQVNYNTGIVSYPVPLGSILDKGNYNYEAQNIRGQLNYAYEWNAIHSLHVLAGYELQSNVGLSTNQRLYGYNPDNISNVNVDYVNNYQTRPSGSFGTLVSNNNGLGTTDHFLSYFFNASYGYKNRYILSASARKDASNLFGVRADQKEVPLWSLGLAWEMSKESFYHSEWLPFLKMRLTNGYNGNISKQVSAYITALYRGPNIFNAGYSEIINPPNPDLRWEKIHVLNAALDFASKNKRIEGSLEYYKKHGEDIIGNSPIAPQTGINKFIGNTANIKGEGVDLTLNIKCIDKKLKWNLSFLLSYQSMIVSSYKMKQPRPANYVSGNYLNPMEGRPYSALFSFKWAGLDPNTGDPMGLLDGHTSTDFAKLINPASIEDIDYSGNKDPKYFGSMLNTVRYGPFSFSFNIVYKMGYVFRRNSLNYIALFGSTNSGGSYKHYDYEKRWQKPGDEKVTNVPSMVYPVNSASNDFYLNSSALVDKGGIVKLQYIQLSYGLKIAGLQASRIFVNADNICTLWRANKDGIDPDFVNSMPISRSFSLGLKLEL